MSRAEVDRDDVARRRIERYRGFADRHAHRPGEWAAYLGVVVALAGMSVRQGCGRDVRRLLRRRGGACRPGRRGRDSVAWRSGRGRDVVRPDACDRAGAGDGGGGDRVLPVGTGGGGGGGVAGRAGGGADVGDGGGQLAGAGRHRRRAGRAGGCRRADGGQCGLRRRLQPGGGRHRRRLPVVREPRRHLRQGLSGDAVAPAAHGGGAGGRPRPAPSRRVGRAVGQEPLLPAAGGAAGSGAGGGTVAAAGFACATPSSGPGGDGRLRRLPARAPGRLRPGRGLRRGVLPVRGGRRPVPAPAAGGMQGGGDPRRPRRPRLGHRLGRPVRPDGVGDQGSGGPPGPRAAAAPASVGSGGRGLPDRAGLGAAGPPPGASAVRRRPGRLEVGGRGATPSAFGGRRRGGAACRAGRRR